MFVVAFMRATGLLVAAMCLHCQEVAAFQTEMSPVQRGALRADRVNRPDIKNTTASTVQGRKSHKRVYKGEGFAHRVWRIGSKGAPTLPYMLPYSEHQASKHRGRRRIKVKVTVQSSEATEMYDAVPKVQDDKVQLSKSDADQRIPDEEIDITSSPGMRIVDAILFIAFGVLAVNSFGDMKKFWLLWREEKMEDSGSLSIGGTGVEDPSMPWSTSMLIGLTAYRFYTGFLTATWLPYLLAMEGQYLWSSNQSMFMGCAKLIYGATILTNPILGLVGDRAIQLSHGIGRRLFVRVGVALAGLGILICMIAAIIEYFYTFMFGIFIWRMGEAINDVTTEALVPELVPAEQFQKASAVKAAMFLFGGLFGYLLLILAAHIHYSWLYYAYLCGMIISCIPVLILLDNDAPRIPPTGRRRQELSFSNQMVEAYLAPSRAEGGFPRACLATFIFSLGTAPMFFLLLLVRDIIGIRDAVELQEHFSGSSIVFFVSAALAAVVSGAGPPRPASANPSAQQLTSQERVTSQEQPQDSGDTPLVKSIVRMTFSVSMFAMLCFILPYVGLFPSEETRLILFYVISALFGYTFGLSFSQFQGITWQLLPPGIDLANAMGFNVMSRLLGIGVGNFIAGLILDFFYADASDSQTDVSVPPDEASGGYRFIGYVFMCTASAITTFIAAVLAYSIAQESRAEAQRARKIAAAG